MIQVGAGGASMNGAAQSPIMNINNKSPSFHSNKSENMSIDGGAGIINGPNGLMIGSPGSNKIPNEEG